MLASPDVQESWCCGPCICDGCNVYDDELKDTKELLDTKYLLDTSSQLFFGTVVSQELLACCDSRADVTFSVLRRWKGSDTQRILIRTWASPILMDTI